MDWRGPWADAPGIAPWPVATAGPLAFAPTPRGHAEELRWFARSHFPRPPGLSPLAETLLRVEPRPKYLMCRRCLGSPRRSLIPDRIQLRWSLSLGVLRFARRRVQSARSR